MATTLFQDLLKKKPKVPSWQDIDPSKVQQDTVAGNLASFEAAKGLAEGFNEFMQSQVSKRLRENVPEFEGLQQQAALNIGKQLRGELSLGDSAAAQRKSVAGTLMRGTAGSQAGSATVLRDLGLTQYGVQQQAQASLPSYLSAMAGIKQAPLFDFSNVFLNPSQRFGMQLENQKNAWNTQWLKNQVKAQGSGVWWALARNLDEDIGLAKQMAVGYFSGGMGGMGGGAGGGSPAPAQDPYNYSW